MKQEFLDMTLVEFEEYFNNLLGEQEYGDIWHLKMKINDITGFYFSDYRNILYMKNPNNYYDAVEIKIKRKIIERNWCGTKYRIISIRFEDRDKERFEKISDIFAYFDKVGNEKKEKENKAIAEINEWLKEHNTTLAEIDSMLWKCKQNVPYDRRNEIIGGK